MKLWNRSLLARLVSSFLILSLVTVGIVGYTAFVQARTTLTQSVVTQLQATAHARQDEFNRWVSDQADILFLISQWPDVRNRTKDLLTLDDLSLDYQVSYSRLLETLRDIVARRPDLQELFILHPEGGEVLISSSTMNRGQDRSDTLYFEEGLSGTFVQNVYPSPETGRSTMTIATPILDERGRRLAVLAVHLNLERMDRIILARTGLGDTVETYLVDQTGLFVSAQRFEQQGSEDAQSEGIDAALHGEDGAGLYENYAGVPVIGIYQWLDDKDLALIAEIEQQEAFAPARNLAYTILLVGAASAVVLVIGVYLLARQIARPILAITDVARRVAAGDLTPNAPVMTRDEVGVLARTFNQMTGQLRALYASMEEQVADRTARLTQANSLLVDEIAERKHAENELRRSRARLDAILSSAMDAIISVDDNQRIILFNTAAEEMFGCSTNEALGQTIDIFIPERYRASHNHHIFRFSQMVDQGQTQQMRGGHVGLRANGEEFPIEASLSQVSVAGQQVFTIILRDITERQRDEAQLLRQNEYLAALHDITLGMVSRLDVHELLTDIITRACTLMGTGHGYIFLLEPDSATMKLQIGLGIPEDKTDYRFSKGCGLIGTVWATEEPLTSNAYYLWTERVQDVNPDLLHPVVGVPLKSRGEVTGVLSLCYTQRESTFDTDKVQLLTRLAQLASVALDNANLYTQAQEARAAAETANRAKSAFLANMSHELRTPLNAVLGFAQLIQRDPGLTPGQRENLSIISRSGEHLLSLINDVLEMSKIEAGRTVLHNVSFDLYRMLEDLEDMFRLRAINKGLHLVFEVAPDLPQHICADENKVRQVLINLIGNAVKFTDTGSVTVRITAQPEETEQHASDTDSQEDGSPVARCVLRCAVEDTGPGIAPDELDTLFEAFVQTQSGQQIQEGTGLGLPISRQFVHLMGGDLTVQSTVNRGSVFAFHIQAELVEIDPEAVLEQNPSREVVGLAAGQTVYRILIVEDKEINRKLLVQLIAPLGFAVCAANNGQEGVAIWENWQPHLIWMDMRMPVMSGYEATRRIKAAPRGQETVIIALTASAFEEERTNILAAGCDDFVSKPFRADVIFDKMAEHLGVQYVYADQDTDGTDQDTSQDMLTFANLQTLPDDLTAHIAQATMEADVDQLLRLLEEVQAYNAALARVLTDLVHNFEYDRILAFVQSSPPALLPLAQPEPERASISEQRQTYL